MQNPSHCLHSAYFHPTLREWQSSLAIKDTNLILPIFVTNKEGEKTEISSMPGNYRYGYDVVANELQPLIHESGPSLRSIILFGVLDDELKDEDGSASYNHSPVPKALKSLREKYGDKLLLCVDICLCAYTTHGHCCVFDPEGEINLPQTHVQLSKMSVAYAQAGADVIAPSDMMDYRIGPIRQALNEAGLKRAILSYSSKFKSNCYGPFRDAAASAPSHGDRAAYQLPFNARELAIQAAVRDVELGADFVMVKPAGMYLDIIRDLKNTVKVPIACYHVSGEFAMLWHAAQAGAVDLEKVLLEQMAAFLRAGCDIIITYYVPLLIEILRRG